MAHGESLLCNCQLQGHRNYAFFTETLAGTIILSYIDIVIIV